MKYGEEGRRLPSLVHMLLHCSSIFIQCPSVFVLHTGPRLSPALSAVANKKLNLQIIATNQRIGLVTEILKIYLETATILSLQRKLSYFPEEV